MFLLYGLAGFALAAGIFLLYAGIGTAAFVDEGQAGALVATWGVGVGFGGFIAAISLPNVIAGYGLLRNRTWGKPMGIGLAVINLVFAPIGTLFGAYALVALLGDDGRAESKLEIPSDDVRPAAPLFALVALLVLACATLVAMVVLAIPFVAVLGGASVVELFAAIFGALAALVLVFAMRRALHARDAVAAARQRALIRAVSARGRGITILEAARATGLTPETCESMLDALARKRWLEIAEDSGRTVYRPM